MPDFGRCCAGARRERPALGQPTMIVPWFELRPVSINALLTGPSVQPVLVSPGKAIRPLSQAELWQLMLDAP